MRVRWQLLGSVVGLAVAGALGVWLGLDVAMMVFGVLLAGLGVVVARTFPERNFEPTKLDRLGEARSIFRRGVDLVRTDHQVLLVLGATLAINSGAEAVDRLFSRRLVDLGFPETPDPILWFTLLSIVGLMAGAVALRIMEPRIDGAGAPRRYYLMGAALAIVGTLLLAWAPSVEVGVIGTFIVRGLGWIIISTVATIWVNRRTPSEVRATVHSFLGQAESVGEILGGIILGVVAQATSITVALTGSAGLFLVAFAIVARSRAGRAEFDVVTVSA